jgi:hypothetical protein
MPIETFAKKYASGLSESFAEVPWELILAAATPCLEFLSEVEAGERAAEFLNDYVYDEIYFERVNVPRKMKPLFGTIEDSTKSMEYKAEGVLVSFRAFVYRMRSSTSSPTPAGWDPAVDTNIPKLAELIRKETSILDAL